MPSFINSDSKCQLRIDYEMVALNPHPPIKNSPISCHRRINGSHNKFVNCDFSCCYLLSYNSPVLLSLPVGRPEQKWFNFTSKVVRFCFVSTTEPIFSIALGKLNMARVIWVVLGYLNLMFGMVLRLCSTPFPIHQVPL